VECGEKSSSAMPAPADLQSSLLTSLEKLEAFSEEKKKTYCSKGKGLKKQL
jgi:hypothetical protein